MSSTQLPRDWHIDISDPFVASVGFPGQVGCNDSNRATIEFLSQGIKYKLADNEALRKDRFAIMDGETRYRVEHITGPKYAVRRIEKAPTFESLNIPPQFKEFMTGTNYNGGLILIAGPTGAGKSSTGAALLKGRLERHGGYCLTLEDPIEFDMRGRYQGQVHSGYLEQMDITEIGYERAISKSLRCFPSGTRCMLYFGEVGDSHSAQELLRIAVNGQTVVTTIHALDIESALLRLISMAGGNQEETRYLLSQSLRMVVHQKLEAGRAIISCLEAEETVKSIIMNNKQLPLRDQIIRSENKIKMLRPGA